MTSAAFIFAIKKKLMNWGFASGFTGGLISLIFSVLCSNAYSDYKNKLLSDEKNEKLANHIEMGELVKADFKGRFDKIDKAADRNYNEVHEMRSELKDLYNFLKNPKN